MTRNDYTDLIKKQINNCLTETTLSGGEKITGKVRDTYLFDDKIVLIATDRQSAFDRVLAAIPFKGQVLNQTSAWWFQQTNHIIPNHVISTPDPNVTIGKKCNVFPIEFVVRGYITGSTDTALWTHYKNGSRNYCGNELLEGLLKKWGIIETIPHLIFVYYKLILKDTLHFSQCKKAVAAVPAKSSKPKVNHS